MKNEERRIMQEIQFIAPAALHDEMLRLRNDKQMDFLESLTGMDWGVADEKDTPEKLRGLGVVYHLESTITGERIALKTATTNRELPEIPSVSDIWKIADFYEREVFDFYGITFVGHPDMRRLYLRNDWIGYPMRKDNDPENRPLLLWRAHANNMYTNWLNYYVYQSTPYDLYGTPDFREI